MNTSTADHNVRAIRELIRLGRLPEAEWDARRHSTFAFLLFPNTILVLHPDYTSILTMYPTAPDETLFSHVMLTPHAPRTQRGGVLAPLRRARSSRLHRPLSYR